MFRRLSHVFFILLYLIRFISCVIPYLEYIISTFLISPMYIVIETEFCGYIHFTFLIMSFLAKFSLVFKFHIEYVFFYFIDLEQSSCNDQFSHILQTLKRHDYFNKNWSFQSCMIWTNAPFMYLKIIGFQLKRNLANKFKISIIVDNNYISGTKINVLIWKHCPIKQIPFYISPT